MFEKSAKRYKTLVVDPPWPYRILPPSVRPAYKLMPLGVIRALPIGEMAEQDSHLYLWVPNAFMAEGLALVKLWGFEYKTTITWAKHQMGTGHYFRNATEHVLFGVRGRLPLMRKDIRTWFLADRREHSRKPDHFYRLAAEASPEPRVDVFSREMRPGWDQVGDQCNFFNAGGSQNE